MDGLRAFVLGDYLRDGRSAKSPRFRQREDAQMSRAPHQNRQHGATLFDHAFGPVGWLRGSRGIVGGGPVMTLARKATS
ncbi:hypothetical protein B7486_03385 [cyanobacterium TDX16]|nr:hypothetical protein B7486_03385 [cyanobacterium TDX16]